MSLTPKQIGHLLDILEDLNRIGDKVRERAIELAHNGVKIPGWEASFSSPQRDWADEEEANDALEALGLKTPKERYRVELLSPAQAEKALRAKKLWPRSNAGVDFVDPFGGLLADKEGKKGIRKTSAES